MGWNDDGDIKTIFFQGVIPIVLGISLCLLGVLYILGILKFSCFKKHDDQVAPVSMMVTNDPATTTTTTPIIMTRAAAEQAFGPVACDAHLWGMSPKERRAVLEAVFSSCCTHRESTKKGTSSSAAAADDGDDRMERGDLGKELDTRCACAICLRDYEDKDIVLTGSNCTHMFHKRCAMVWMANYKKPKDHCPYCRKEMMTAEEMKNAAVNVLGVNRVRELSDFQRANHNYEANNRDDNSTVILEVPNI